MIKKLFLKKVMQMLEKNREKKNICMPTHITESEAIYVAEQANERDWSNSAYIRHLIRQDRKRYLDALYLMDEVSGESSERFELNGQSERIKKNPVGATTELDAQYGG
ncbi:hypothetical protein [Acinetobacter sp. ANC 4218]|uniref:hypothetical protein n=1 Tax=Acinetobacter sp. ANC 4218 TaxID=1977880 RepID=UPI0020756F2B|nr:hypothetical protein [Acinetobacter sp. ANC 4218]